MSPMNPRLLRPTGQFDPRRIAGLEMYLNAKVGSSITLNGSNVSEWRDLSGKGRHASQSNGLRQPDFSATSWGGRPSVNFTRANAHHLSFTPFVLTAQTAFFVLEPTAAVPVDNRADILNNITSTNGQGNAYSFLNVSGFRTYGVVLGGLASGTPNSVGANLFAQEKMLLSHTYNNAGSTTAANHGVRKNRLQQTPESQGVFGMVINIGSIGMRTDATFTAISARIAMILLYSRVLSAAEISAIENWAVSEYPL